MKIKMLFVLFLLLVVAVFSVQNAQVISVRFLGWRFDLSEALVILIAAFSGGLAGLVVGAFAGRRAPPKKSNREPTPKV